jgi:hypothetical protein
MVRKLPLLLSTIFQFRNRPLLDWPERCDSRWWYHQSAQGLAMDQWWHYDLDTLEPYRTTARWLPNQSVGVSMIHILSWMITNDAQFQKRQHRWEQGVIFYIVKSATADVAVSKLLLTDFYIAWHIFCIYLKKSLIFFHLILAYISHTSHWVASVALSQYQRSVAIHLFIKDASRSGFQIKIQKIWLVS